LLRASQRNTTMIGFPLKVSFAEEVADAILK
jgi:hypothetical protein